MKKHLPIFLFILALWIASCQPQATEEFGIYLLAEDRPATELTQENFSSMELQEPALIATDDIVSYDRLTHEIQLTAEAYRRFQEIFPRPVRVDGIPFVVRVGDEPIYPGALWTPASSLSYDGVTIMQPFGDEGQTITIALGYPGSFNFSGPDPRADGRIIETLEQAGKLQ